VYYPLLLIASMTATFHGMPNFVVFIGPYLRRINKKNQERMQRMQQRRQSRKNSKYKENSGRTGISDDSERSGSSSEDSGGRFFTRLRRAMAPSTEGDPLDATEIDWSRRSSSIHPGSTKSPAAVGGGPSQGLSYPSSTSLQKQWGLEEPTASARDDSAGVSFSQDLEAVEEIKPTAAGPESTESSDAVGGEDQQETSGEEEKQEDDASNDGIGA